MKKLLDLAQPKQLGFRPMNWMLDRIRHLIAAYLQKSVSGYEPFTPAEPTALRACIKPGDILLIEGTIAFLESSNI